MLLTRPVREFVQTKSMFVIQIHGEAAMLASVAAAGGWRAVGEHADEIPDLIVVTDASAGAAVRGCATPRAAAPIVLVATEAGSPPRGIDQVVAPPIDEARARAILDRWRPDATDALDRIEAAFGVATVRDMLLRLRDQLQAALDEDAPDDAARRAHRLGGIAGMLGFGALGDAWLAVERDPPGAIGAARIETRRALAAIARRLY